MTNVKNYNDRQLLERVVSIGGQIPNKGKYLIIGVQSNEDAFDLFDDKFYMFDGDKFIMTSSGTTNPGKTALLYYDKYDLSGCAVWRTDEFYNDLYKPGYHKSRMRALRQEKPIYFFRDTDKDVKSEQLGKVKHDIIYANMHGVDYDPNSKIIKTNIGGWSFGCQVWNNMVDYRKMITLTWARNKPVDYCLLMEF